MKNDHHADYEVAQLQKFFFMEFVWLPYFQSDIMEIHHTLPKNIFFTISRVDAPLVSPAILLFSF